MSLATGMNQNKGGNHHEGAAQDETEIKRCRIIYRSLCLNGGDEEYKGIDGHKNEIQPCFVSSALLIRDRFLRILHFSSPPLLMVTTK